MDFSLIFCLLFVISYKKRKLFELLLNEAKFTEDLEKTGLSCSGYSNYFKSRRYPNPYEALKDLTKTNSVINQTSIHTLIETLNVSDDIKNELKQITPSNYLEI